MANIYKIGSNILRSAGGGGIWRPPAGGGNFTFDSNWSGTAPTNPGDAFSFTYSPGGLGFAADPRAKLFISGESDFTSNGTYARDSFTPSIQNNAAHDTSIKPVGSAGSLRQTWPTAGNNGCWWNNDPLFTGSGKFFIYSKRRYSMTYGSNNDNNYNAKEDRFWPAGGTGFDTPDTYFSQRPTSQNYTTEGVPDPQANGDGSRSYNALYQTNTWQTFRVFFQDCTGADVYDGILNAENMGMWAFIQAKRFRTKTAGLTASKARVFSAQFSGGGDGGDVYPPDGSTYNMSTYWGNDKFAHIFLSDMTSFQTALLPNNGTQYQHEIWLPTSGSDSTVGGASRLGSLNAYSGKAVWVCTEDYQHIRVGVYS